jgi:cytidylate kinase
MAAITISRQLGSQGDDVAQAVAQRLGYQVMYRELINQAAQRAGAPEMALDFFDVLGLLKMQTTQDQAQTYRQAMQQVMAERAAQGKVVLIGRAGCLLLRDCPGVLHVRVIAPLSQRIARVAQTRSISRRAAHAQVEASDCARRAYVQAAHNVDWNDPQLYHLVLNMEQWTIEDAAEIICLAHARSMH